LWYISLKLGVEGKVYFGKGVIFGDALRKLFVLNGVFILGVEGEGVIDGSGDCLVFFGIIE
jgi:hypothetical protein